MQPSASAEAAALLWHHWRHTTRIDALPASCRPQTRADGYAVQSEIARLSGQAVAGWKIAATSAAGQRHIGIDGPIASCLLADRVVADHAQVTLGDNSMRVAEAEFAFRLAQPLPARPAPYSLEEVVQAVDSLHLAIEVPDSRYNDFARVGAPQLIADSACACWLVVGAALSGDWRARDLVAHRVIAYRNRQAAGEGSGANVLGDPRRALTWIANELSQYSGGLGAGALVTTGTCVTPVAVAPGDHIRMDFGDFGSIQARFA